MSLSDINTTLHPIESDLNVFREVFLSDTTDLVSQDRRVRNDLRLIAIRQIQVEKNLILLLTHFGITSTTCDTEQELKEFNKNYNKLSNATHHDY
ncbi:MAG: hypothetical protein LN590_04570 [Rickettsia endosymbiont of Glossina mortisans submortisans]|nr:hypothetical protein [Rickettsia endosymbiont of Glossina mortisans submortisans]